MLTTIHSIHPAPGAPAAKTTAAPATPSPAAPTDTVSLGSTDAPRPERKWTVMVYSAADNNLEPYMFTNLDDAEKVGSDPTTAIVAQFDAGKKGCSRLYITKDDQVGKLNSQVVEDMGKRVDMASAKTLSEFVQWGMQKYPAEHYMLIVSDHGDGWRGVCEDDSEGTWMDLPTLHKGLADAQAATGKKLDVLGFDACLMASTEVAHQLQGQTAYLVGSEETEGGAGWPYTRVLNEKMLADMQHMLADRINLSPRDLAAHVVRSASTVTSDLPTMTAIDTEKVPALTKAVDAFGQAILDTKTPMKALKKLSGQTQGFYEYKDLYDFADRVSKSSSVSDKTLKAAAATVKSAVKDAIVAEEHSRKYPNAHGITIELTGPPSGYEAIAFAKDTTWARALDKLNG